jgi:hypothetical protein
MSPRILLTLVAVLALAVVGVVVFRSSGRNDALNAASPDSLIESGLQAEDDAKAVPESANSVPELAAARADDRSQAPTVAWMGRVVGPEGQPVPAAELSWGALLPEWASMQARPHRDHGAALNEHLQKAVSAEDGQFRFDQAPNGSAENGSVLWVTAEGMRAQSVLIAAGDSALPGQIQLVGEPSTLVRVVDVSGNRVPAAEVLQFLNLSNATPAVPLSPEQAGRKLYVRTLRTDAQGECRIPTAEGVFFAYARSGKLLSSPVFQQGNEAISLVLRETFQLEGQLRLPAAGLQAQGAYLVAYGLLKPGKSEGSLGLCGRIEFREDGSFGPLDLPCVSDFKVLRLRAGGGPLLESYVDRAMPQPGDRVYVSLDLVLGESLSVEVADQQGKPVAKAFLQASSTPSWNTFVTASKAETDEQGRARLLVPQSQAFLIGAWAEPLAPATVGPLLFTPGMEPVRIEMQPAGGVQVRLTRRGEAVPKYRLSFWQGDPRKGWVEACDNAEGVATISDLAPGSYSMQATAGDWPQTRPLTVTVEAGGLTECHLEIPEPVAARGRVVDAQTGEPLPQAHIMLHNSVGTSLSWSRDIVIPVDSQGGFTLPQVGEAGGAIMVSAEGYAVAVENYRFDPAQGQLHRVIALQRRSPLEVIVSEPSGMPLKGYFVSSPMGLSLPPTPLPEDGHLLLPGQSPSAALINLHLPDGSLMNQWVAISSQPRNIVRFTLGGSARLEVKLGGGDAARRAVGGELILRSLERHGEAVRSLRVPQSNPVVLAGLAAGEYTLELRNAREEITAARPVRLQDGLCERVELTPSSQTVELAIVDASREPLSGVKVEAVGQEAGAHWYLRGITDARGRLALGAVPPGRAILALDHDDLGLQRGRELNLRSGLNTVSFEAGSRLELLVTERGEPRAGIVVLFEHKGHSALARSRYTSDEHGRVLTQTCNDGEYTVFVRHLGYWLEERTVRLPSPKPIALPLRALGDVRLVALDNYKEPVPGVRIELECAELGGTLSRWIEAGRVAMPAGGLRTGSNGELQLRGLPAGEYRFRALKDSDGGAEGRFTLAGRGETRVEMPVR